MNSGQLVPRTGGRHLPARWAWGLVVGALLSGCGIRVLLEVRPVTLAPDARVWLGGGGNSFAFLHGGDAFVVDLKFLDFARRQRRQVEEELGRKVRRLLLTHSHVDHAGGLALYPEAGAVLVHPRTRARLERQREGMAGVAFVEVDDEARLLLGKEEVVVKYLGVGHTDGDLVAWLPGRKLLVAGDLFLNGYEPHVDEKAGGNTLALRYTLDRMLELPFETVVPGHGEVGTRADVERWRDYLAKLEAEVRAGIAAGRTEDDLARNIRLPEYAYQVIPLGEDRERNVRQMYRAVLKAGKERSP